MPSYAEVAKYWDVNREECRRYYGAVMQLYDSIDGLDIQAAVDATPAALVSKYVTFSVLIALGHGKPDVRARVIAKVVEMRLTS